MAGPGPVGFVGLGAMGGQMAACLARRFAGAAGAAGAGAGRRLVLYDVRPEAASWAAEYPRDVVSTAASLPELARGTSAGLAVGTVLLCLPNGESVRETVGALAPLLREGALVIDCSTTGPDVAQAVASELAMRDSCLGFLDAPVTGLPERAADGTLTAMVGGQADLLETARPILSTFASRVVHMGPVVGSGQIAKAFNNCLYNVSIAAMAEMLPLAKKTGLSLEAFIEVVNSGSGQSFGFAQWAPKVLRREFEAPRHGFPMGEAYKDFQTLQAVAEKLEVPSCTPVVQAARITYEKALEAGLAGENKSAMVKIWERAHSMKCHSDGGASEE